MSYCTKFPFYFFKYLTLNIESYVLKNCNLLRLAWCICFVNFVLLVLTLAILLLHTLDVLTMYSDVTE